jgi:DEAD/DEAH box helicase domain-containing protein
LTPLFSDPALRDQITHMEELPATQGSFAPLPPWLHPAIRESLERHSIHQLFTHQGLAIDAWQEGRNTVVTTGTNSGKTLCYTVPVLQSCLTEPAARCLMLFPTKALAQDQLARLRELRPDDSVCVETYDGDTPKSKRPAIRQGAHVVIANPDILHVGILPNHEQWSRFFKSLRVIAIDEMHSYRGVFGSHVGNVLRRLLRVCEVHGSKPQIITCSATIGNPLEVFEKLTGQKAVLIDQDGAPKGKRTFVFWNPPQIGEEKRLSANVVTSEILVNLIQLQQKSLAFSRSRVGAELVLQYARKRLASLGPKVQQLVDSYRAGYTPAERRQIEGRLFKGKLLALSSTNAMELGVDVGLLDAVVMNGYPGSASSFWQQAGRAGRGSRDGLAIMVAHSDPLEQFLVRSPEILLKSQRDGIALDPTNVDIARQHLLCAAYEIPLSASELQIFGPTALEIAEALDRAGELQFQRGRFYYTKQNAPAPGIDIRGTGGENISLQVNGVELGHMEQWRAIMQAHQGAVYLHRGETYIVDELDIVGHRAALRAAKVDYYTQSTVQSVLNPSTPIKRKSMPHAEVSYGRVSVTEMVTDYKIRKLVGDTVIGVEPLDLPPQSYESVAVRLDLPAFPFDKHASREIGGVHAVEHALLAVAPLLAGCDRADLGSVWYSVLPETTKPAIFIVDRTPGGVGLSERLYASLGGWIKGALQLLTSCDCVDGCPACLLSPRCECANETLHKPTAIRILSHLS